MTGPSERGMGDTSPPKGVALPVTETSGSEDVSSEASTDGNPEASSDKAIIPAQATASAADEPADDDVGLQVPTREEVSAELAETHVPLGRRIASDGYDEHDVHELRVETQVKYFKARMKGVPLRHGRPWPFLIHCYKWIRLDFHKKNPQNHERPGDVESLDLPDPAPCAMDQVALKEAIESFLERHLPDARERQVWLMTHRDHMGRTEIAKNLRIDRGTVSARLARAEERLRSLPPDELNHLL